ncbi:MAG: DUF6132 family protein [Bacteroidales bacterium]|jgi:hypothetical protein|nr:DUF6132 family protein [Bacteroidales bacterium]
MSSEEKKSVCPQWAVKLRKQFTLPSIIGVSAGIIAGYFYYREIGCKGGSCPITSNPWLTILWGAIMGFLIGSMFNKKANDLPGSQDENNSD